MKAISILYIFLFTFSAAYAQLTIIPSAFGDSYVYVDGALLYVQQDVNLGKNANDSPTEASIYLRKEGQLIQGEDEAATNTGSGLLSIFQEGTSNAYDYNYWASPVSDGVSGIGNFGIRMLYAPFSPTESQKAKLSPALDGVSSPLTISQRWIFSFSGNSYSQWKPIMDQTAIPAGYGFTMKGVNGVDHTEVDGVQNNPGSAQRYDFRGRPNSGLIPIPISTGEFTLVGNPFPSALDLSLFLLENSGTGLLSTSCGKSITRNPATTGIAYFWDSVANGNSHYLEDYVGGYGAFSPVDPCTEGIYEKPVFRRYGAEGEETGIRGRNIARRYLPIAQGFKVKGTSNSDVVFSNNQRVFVKEGEHSQFKSREQNDKTEGLAVIPKIRIQAIINDKITRHLTLGFWPTATPLPDFGMDAESYDSPPNDIGFLQEGRNYIIDVRPFAATAVIPLYLKIEDTQANVTISVNEIENFEGQDIFILDSLYNTYFPITNNVFRMVLEKGVYHNRFKIALQEQISKPDEEEFPDEELIISHNQQESRLEVINLKDTRISSVALFDLLGKQLYFSPHINAKKFHLSTINFANSVYIVQVIMADRKRISKKISILNQ